MSMEKNMIENNTLHNFFEYARSGDVLRLMGMLSAGVHADVRDEERRTALYVASYSGHKQCILALIAAGADVHLFSYGMTAVHIAALCGFEPCVRTLIEAGACVNARDIGGNRTALHLAAEKGSEPCVRTLLGAGAYVNARNRDGECAIDFTMSSEPCFLLLLEAGSEFSKTSILAAAEHGSEVCMRELLRTRPDLHVTNGSDQTALHIAASNGHTYCVKALIKAGAYIHVTDDDGNTPLHAAIQGGFGLCVDQLVEAGSNLNARNNIGETVLHMALQSKMAELAIQFIEAGVNVNVQDNDGNSALHLASWIGNEPCVKALIASGSDVSLRDDEESTPIHCAASRAHGSCVRLLIEAGSYVHAIEHDGVTLLHSTSKSILYVEYDKYESCVHALITAGAGLEERDANGMTALQMALSHAAVQEYTRGIDMMKHISKQVRCAFALIMYGADPIIRSDDASAYPPLSKIVGIISRARLDALQPAAVDELRRQMDSHGFKYYLPQSVAAATRSSLAQFDIWDDDYDMIAPQEVAALLRAEHYASRVGKEYASFREDFVNHLEAARCRGTLGCIEYSVIAKSGREIAFSAAAAAAALELSTAADALHAALATQQSLVNDRFGP